jgi:hypothetical protein
MAAAIMSTRGHMSVIARITLREMSEDERPDDLGRTAGTA